MKMLKFCMVTTFYPPYNFGGDGVFVYRLANALANQGHEVHVIHDIDAFALFSNQLPAVFPPSHPNIKLHSLSRNGIGSLDLLIIHQLGRPVSKHQQIKAILEQAGFDVIHFHNISLLGGPDILKYGNAIKLCTLHDHWFVCAMHVLWRFDREVCTQRTCLTCTLASHRPPQLWRYTGALAGAVRHVDAFIAGSKFTCESHVKNGFPAPIRYIPHFLPETEVHSATNASDGDCHPRPYFMFVGRLEKIKGVQVLLEQFHTYNEADLLIAGTGTYEAKLREMAQSLTHVHFLGKLEHSQLQKLYRQAIAVIVPSLCSETFGLTAIEALALGTPVIVHDIGALPEIVQTTEGGFIYHTNNELLTAMEALRTQPHLRCQLGEQGYKSYLKYYTEVQHLSNYYNLISELQSIRNIQQVQV